jgi:hypothetical protein
VVLNEGGGLLGLVSGLLNLVGNVLGSILFDLTGALYGEP